MKGDKKILIIAALLLLISASFTTYAIYRDSTTATGSIKAANWVVKIDKGVSATTPIANANMTFTAEDITWTGTHYGKNNTIAPGDSGTIQFTVDATGSEVDVVVEAEIDSNASIPDGMTAVITGGGTQNITYNATSMTATVTITVTWSGSVADSSSKDGTDKAVAGTNLSLPVNITVRQAAPAS